MYDKPEEVSDADLAEIANQIVEGYTSGINDDDDGHRISWSITIEKFKH